MADDRAEPREVTWRTLLPWTELFRGFSIALDLNKLLLAAAGLVATAIGWVVLAWIFTKVGGYGEKAPTPPDTADAKAWHKFRVDRDEWNLMHKTAGVGNPDAKYEAADFAESPEELNGDKVKGTRYARLLDTTKPYAEMATMPWSEDRGPNPFLLVTGQATTSWEAGHFWDWFTTKQAPVLIEPLVKFLQPIIYFFSPHASATARFYFFFVLIWTLVVWSLFGGAITRIAAVQVARNERIGMTEAVKFAMKRLTYYISAPLFPLVFVLGLLIIMMIFGVFHMIPIFGDIVVDGLLYWVMIGFGLLMAVALVGLIGWPLMATTISTEGTDSWEAVSRTYTYVFQKPWHYFWYGLVSICYGAVVVFFIGFMGSMTVYLSKWGVSETPGIGPRYADREPSYLFVYAPTSFGWRTLLLEGVTVDVPEKTDPETGKKTQQATEQKLVQLGEIKPDLYNQYLDSLHGWNKVGAGLVAIWVGLLFLLVLGFAYSFFWSSATIIYLLMRRNVDTAELDEVYLEEDDQDGAYAGPLTPTPAPEPAKTSTPLQMIESPALKTPAPEPESKAPTPSPNGGPTAPPS